MKKLAKLSVLLLVGVLVFTGCSDKNDKKLDNDSEKGSSVQENKDEKKLVCKKTGQVTTGVEADLLYEVTYSGSYVNKVHTVEKLKSDSEEYLNQYKTLVEEGYKNYKDLKYYDYNVEVKDGVLTSTVDIDYSKIDTDKMIEIDSDNAALIKNGKIKIEDMKTLYQQVGATCED